MKRRSVKVCAVGSLRVDAHILRRQIVAGSYIASEIYAAKLERARALAWRAYQRAALVDKQQALVIARYVASATRLESLAKVTRLQPSE